MKLLLYFFDFFDFLTLFFVIAFLKKKKEIVAKINIDMFFIQNKILGELCMDDTITKLVKNCKKTTKDAPNIN